MKELLMSHNYKIKKAVKKAAKEVMKTKPKKSAEDVIPKAPKETRLDQLLRLAVKGNLDNMKTENTLKRVNENVDSVGAQTHHIYNEVTVLTQEVIDMQSEIYWVRFALIIQSAFALGFAIAWAVS